MRYAHVGASGLEVSRLVLGMMSFGDTSRRAWHLDLDAARPLVRRAAEAGITAYDTADVYDRGVSEEVTGRLLRETFGHREDYVLSTKVYYPMSDSPGDRGLSRRHVLSSVDGSLRRLRTDHLDLYYVHRWDHETPIEETMEALDT
jgi:aryl-alcohol dehydrogenase-like predicted oxidoreductase